MRVVSRGLTLVSFLLALLTGCGVAVYAQAPLPTTTVADTVYNASGAAASGTVLVSWSGFTAASGASIPAGSTSATIAANGALSISLAPNAGATPIGSYYTATFHLSDGTTSRQYWVVPVTLPGGAGAKLSAIQNSVLPTSVAMQTVSKAYVDSAIAAAVTGTPLDTTSPYMQKTGDTLTGPLVLPGDPVSPLQAADKNYVDETVTAMASSLSSRGINGTTPYTGLVATHTEVAVSTLASSTATYIQNCSFHIARTNIAANTLQPMWQNYYVTYLNVETAVGTSATYQASIVYPADPTKQCGSIGTEYSCTVNGSSVATVPAMGDAMATCANPAIATGTGFWVKVQYQNAAGVPFSGIGINYFSAATECFNFGTGTPGTFIGSGAACAGSTGSSYNGYPPIAILGQTSAPSVCIIGDSRATGIMDAITNASLDVGEEARWVGPYFAYTKLSVAATTGAQALTNFTNRLRVVGHCSDVIDEYGINDLSSPASTVAATRASLATLFGKPTYGTTLPSTTTSTDNWATITNQTVSTNTSAFNALVRAGISGELAVFDVEDALEAYTPGTNKWPVARIPGATGGTANYATPDGIHEDSTMNQLIENSMARFVSWIKR